MGVGQHPQVVNQDRVLQAQKALVEAGQEVQEVLHGQKKMLLKKKKKTLKNWMKKKMMMMRDIWS